MPNLYVDLATMKAWLQEQDRATEDSRILLLLADVSRMIDEWTSHHFYVRTATEYPRASRADRILLKPLDLLAVTSLATDVDGGRTYGTTWEATDYDLEPEGNPRLPLPHPYWEIAARPHGRYPFPTERRGVQVTGRWGFYEVLERSAATTAAALDASATALNVSDGSLFAVGHTLLVDDEQLAVAAVDGGADGNTLTVTRGVNGTTAASHLPSAAIDVYTYPMVREAVKEQFNRWAARRDSPLGAMGSAEFGVLRLSARLDPDVQTILAPFRARRVG
jgi:hypothetical protein